MATGRVAGRLECVLLAVAGGLMSTAGAAITADYKLGPVATVSNVAERRDVDGQLMDIHDGNLVQWPAESGRPQVSSGTAWGT